MHILHILYFSLLTWRCLEFTSSMLIRSGSSAKAANKLSNILEFTDLLRTHLPGVYQIRSIRYIFNIWAGQCKDSRPTSYGYTLCLSSKSNSFAFRLIFYNSDECLNRFHLAPLLHQRFWLEIILQWTSLGLRYMLVYPWIKYLTNFRRS